MNFDASPTLVIERIPILGALLRKNSARFPRTVRYGDVIRGLPVGKASVDAVYASHVLEHLSRSDFGKALGHVHDILRPGGRFRLIVPDLEWRSRAYVAALDAGRTDANDAFMRTAHLGMETRSLVTSLGNSLHLWMWDEPSMRAALAAAGFVGIRRCRLGDSGDPMFDRVEEQSRFVDQGTHDELAMEALRAP